MTDPASASDRREFLLLDGQSGRILASLSLAFLVIVTGRLLLPPLLPAISDDFGITAAGAGLVLTILQGAESVALFPSGRLSDRLSRATVIVPALAILTLGVALIGSAPVYPVLILGAMTFGLGSGLFSISARASISDHFVDRRGRALGIFSAGFSVGAVVASGLAVLAIANWRLAFYLLVGLFIPITALYVAWNRDPFVLDRVPLRLGSSVRRLATADELREPLIGFALFGFAIQAFIGFFPTFLVEAKGFSAAVASGAFALVFVVGVGSKIAAGALSDRYPRRYVATGGMIVSAVTLVGIVLVDDFVPLMALTVVFALGHQAEFPLIDAILLDAAPDDVSGGDLGAARTVYRLVGSLGPLFLGFVAGIVGFAAAFGTLVPILLLSSIVLFVGRGRAA